MSGVPRQIKKVFYAVSSLANRGLNKIQPRQAKLIKQTYFIFVFFFVLIGLVIGIKKGRSAAGINLPPLAESVNDVFEFDIKRERTGADFLSMTDSALLAEEQSTDKKISFGENGSFNMEYDSGILDYKPEKAMPSLMLELEPAEALPPLGRMSSEVNLLQSGIKSEMKDTQERDGESLRAMEKSFPSEPASPSGRGGEAVSPIRPEPSVHGSIIWDEKQNSESSKNILPEAAEKKSKGTSAELLPMKDFSEVVESKTESKIEGKGN